MLPLLTLDNTTWWRYYLPMIKSFAGKETEKLFRGTFSSKLPHDLQRVAQRKLRVPPGNRLEQLSGNREGQWSIRINEQWRICFRWEAGNAFEVEITDYH
jgi:proteic killer suppression protein